MDSAHHHHHLHDDDDDNWVESLSALDGAITASPSPSCPRPSPFDDPIDYALSQLVSPRPPDAVSFIPNKDVVVATPPPSAARVCECGATIAGTSPAKFNIHLLSHAHRQRLNRQIPGEDLALQWCLQRGRCVCGVAFASKKRLDQRRHLSSVRHLLALYQRLHPDLTRGGGRGHCPLCLSPSSLHTQHKCKVVIGSETRQRYADLLDAVVDDLIDAYPSSGTPPERHLLTSVMMPPLFQARWRHSDDPPTTSSSRMESSSSSSSS